MVLADDLCGNVRRRLPTGCEAGGAFLVDRSLGAPSNLDSLITRIGAMLHGVPIRLPAALVKAVKGKVDADTTER
jgi:hypothetical protein